MLPGPCIFYNLSILYILYTNPNPNLYTLVALIEWKNAKTVIGLKRWKNVKDVKNAIHTRNKEPVTEFYMHWLLLES